MRPRITSARRSGFKTYLRDWRVKGVIQKLLSYAPAGDRLHAQLQRRFGGLASFERECDERVEDWRLLMGHLRAAEIDVGRAVLLEIGTGWYPALPVCLYLAGAARVITVDLVRHLDPELLRRLLAFLEGRLAFIATTAGVPEAEVAARHAALAGRAADPLELASDGRIEYRAPGDASETHLPVSSVDVVFSNSVLEHIPPRVLERCFVEAFRILRPGGAMVHSVNCGDHYAYTDPAISQLNYLQFSDERWRWWNNDFLYQNRLRAVDFTDLARRTGFAIERDTSRASPERLAQLDGIDLAPEFRRYSRDQLAITSIDFIARRR